MKCLQLVVVVLVLVVPVMAQKPGAFPSGRIVDLTYAFDANSVYWPRRSSSNSKQILKE